MACFRCCGDDGCADRENEDKGADADRVGKPDDDEEDDGESVKNAAARLLVRFA